jgi:hypothetical protein
MIKCSAISYKQINNNTNVNQTLFFDLLIKNVKSLWKTKKIEFESNPLIKRTAANLPLFKEITPKDIAPAMQHILSDLESNFTN